ncbi:S8 family peptidase [Natronobacterium gregoryi]|uniref:Serine protease n=2 Tax=Natronobacterium gregoryi TaxID=44930 RepID=L0AMW2_NATGS|nr:S8 family peptidase [Natronobacterium gregoryi]AFZ74809.1 subtilisin-like serine protease [Natronobacterium gregoryi SP2]ELY66141.1 subtilisin-like serine protease [Natronobacterium gregoryi SP2]PLK19484.1 serine protease [Natronobacterium gregoryi SP2]SFJ43530.1 subtilisin [Natronobacterium gregoryi]
MSDNDVTRRRLLRGTAVGAATTGVAGTAIAQGPPERKVVGLTADTPFGPVRQAADEVHHELDFDRTGKVLVGRFPEEAIEGLERNPHVRYVEDEQRAYALQTVPWGVDRVGADVLHDEDETGSGGSIAIVDTGVQVDHESLTVDGGEAFGTSCTGCEEPYGDDNGHGTHCAGTAVAPDNDVGVVGVALESELYAVKVLNSWGSGTFSDVAAGVEWAADQGIDVISLSLGGDSPQQALEDACQYAVDQGSLVVAAAGNDGCCDSVGYPAAYDTVVAVSSTNDDDDISSFSSRGPEVDIAAPGSAIYSTYTDNGYNTLSGTSMACPHVAGAAAHLMGDDQSNTEAREQLFDTAEDIDLDDNEQGNGLLDAQEAVLGDTDPPEPGLSVSTDSATGVSDTTATLNGTLTEFADADSVEVYFEWGEAGGNLPNETTPQTLTETGSFDDDLAGLSEGTDYEFRAVAEADDDADTGLTQSFTTDSEGGCFITTATAGEGKTLNSLRRFRDDSMSATPIGRGLVDLYYRISPPIATTLERHPESRTVRAVRAIVDRCGSLSDEQAATDSRTKSASLGVALTTLYVVGILVGAGGHAGIRLRELLE